MKVECRPEDFGEILERVKENLKPEMERKQLTWKININPALPLIHADSDRIQQVLMNLIGNAIKYTEHGSILLEANASKSFVEVNIQDNGMGIPEEELRLVLEDYQRGTNVATTPGTGLGLNLSRHIIELHGGELSIESEVGKGQRLESPSRFQSIMLHKFHRLPPKPPCLRRISKRLRDRSNPIRPSLKKQKCWWSMMNR